MTKNTILVVDDDELVRQSLAGLLKKWQFEVLQASTAAEASPMSAH